MTAPLLAGFLLGLSLILPIGAQNAFVLRIGLRGEHVLAVCLTCALSDAVLILAGVSGFAQLSARVPWAETILLYGGAAFLLAHGARSFMAAFGSASLRPSEAAPESLSRVVLTCLAFTWLNPHVYLDTVVLIGSISTQFDEGKGWFAAGAMTASFVFFFSLGFGARLLKPLFARPVTWRILDIAIGLIMWATAARLLLNGSAG
jgi:L-lysine exporter family protein LysE/ArgO